jgi:hypothetical protein
MCGGDKTETEKKGSLEDRRLKNRAADQINTTVDL